MAQLLLIKTANTALKTIGDVVGIFEDKHKFSKHELVTFNVLQITGTREEVAQKLDAIRIPIEQAFLAKTTKWSLERPEQKEVWQDTFDDKWYFLEAPLKYVFSTSGLTSQDKTLLETTNTGLERDVVFKKMVVNPADWDAKNTVEVKDLNG